jgi:hypothetical protein
LHDIEGNLLTFFEGLETAHVDGGKMREKIFAAIIRSDKAKTLGIIEPLDGTECHVCNFHTRNEKFTGLPDSLFELSDPMPEAPLMQRESKHKRFLPPSQYRVNNF